MSKNTYIKPIMMTRSKLFTFPQKINQIINQRLIYTFNQKFSQMYKIDTKNYKQNRTNKRFSFGSPFPLTLTAATLVSSTLFTTATLTSSNINEYSSSENWDMLGYTASSTTNKLLKDISKLYENYIDDPQCVYKICSRVDVDVDVGSGITNRNRNRNRDVLVILRKLPTTKTNEDRNNIYNQWTAQFTADKLEVLKIIDLQDPTITLTTAINKYIHVSVAHKLIFLYIKKYPQ
jgi:hypothetical protein